MLEVGTQLQSTNGLGFGCLMSLLANACHTAPTPVDIGLHDISRSAMMVV